MLRKRIGIVYFVYINPLKNYRKFILGQLNDVKRSGILTEAELHLVVSNPKADENAENFIKNLPYECASIEIYHENTYEYHGIHRIYTLALKDEYDYLIYFHTKGMSYKNKYLLPIFNIRCIREKLLTLYTFRRYRQTLSFLDAHPHIVRAGFAPMRPDLSEVGTCDDGTFDIGAGHDFLWYNFFWVRSEFVRLLEEPTLEDNRFYYESWLCNLKKAESIISNPFYIQDGLDLPSDEVKGSPQNLTIGHFHSKEEAVYNCFFKDYPDNLKQRGPFIRQHDLYMHTCYSTFSQKVNNYTENEVVELLKKLRRIYKYGFLWAYFYFNNM